VTSQRVAAAIIAGGAGRRLGGVDKTSLVVGGRTILERQLAVLQPLFSRIFLVLGPTAPAGPAAPAGPTRALPPSGPSAPASVLPSAPVSALPSAPLTVLRDRAPAGSGPLAGLDAALSALAEGPETAVVCLAGDMPLVTPALVQLIRDAFPTAPAVVPHVGGRAQPLLARYHRSCAGPIQAALAARALKTQAVLEHLGVTWLDEATLRTADPQLRSFENANTPEDLARIEALSTSAV
jgi:molybdopterin-guanine dinucleotide biosynthesis protein A